MSASAEIIQLDVQVRRAKAEAAPEYIPAASAFFSTTLKYPAAA
jgi:hypothetical protein